MLGAWLTYYVRASLKQDGERPDGYFVIPVCVVLAYMLGPVTLTQPLWLPVGVVVAAVLLVGSRKYLHDLAQKVPFQEVLTLAQFLLLVGVVLPILYGAPRIPYTKITPFSVWLAVVAVSTLSYASYLLQRYVFTKSGVLLAAVLGGMYSSTATTVVMARKAAEEGVTPAICAGIIAATGMMYARMVIICSIFNQSLGRAIAPTMLVLCVLCLAGAAALVRFDRAKTSKPTQTQGNPLQLGTAVIFACLMIGISLVSGWVQTHLGSTGILVLAAVVGVTDIDPFVMSLAQGGAASLGIATAAAAVIIASSSNNVLKAGYTAAFSRRRESWMPAGALVVTSLLGLIGVWFASR